jgi:hypothetical protein
LSTTSRKELTWGFRCRWEDNIKMDIKEYDAKMQFEGNYLRI